MGTGTGDKSLINKGSCFALVATHISGLGDTENEDPDRASIRAPVRLTTSTRWAEDSGQW